MKKKTYSFKIIFSHQNTHYYFSLLYFSTKYVHGKADDFCQQFKLTRQFQMCIVVNEIHLVLLSLSTQQQQHKTKHNNNMKEK